MIVQTLTLNVKQGMINELESAVRSAYEMIAEMQGCLGHELYKCIENKDEYLFLIRWSSIKDQAAGVRHSLEYKKFTDILEPFYASRPEIKHYIDIPVKGRERAVPNLVPPEAGITDSSAS